jgi:hypothetical protein
MNRKPIKLATKKASADKPRKLGEAAGWLRRNPNGLGGRILDMRAVMR